jgi:hypothetical protein
MPMVKRASWLSVTPEPERELPQAVATLVHGPGAPATAVAAERARIERLVLHGSERQWLAYLHGVVDLIASREGSSEEIGFARSRAAAVIANHHNLLLGLPGTAAERTAPDRQRLAALAEAGT